MKKDNSARVEIFLNKEKALDWGHFDLELAFPIKNLKGA
jgi:hypothetical protein